jgi:hypothetical protein
MVKNCSIILNNKVIKSSKHAVFSIWWHSYVPFVIIKSFSQWRLITGFVARVTRRVPHVEQDYLCGAVEFTPCFFYWLRVTRSLVFCNCFLYHCLSFCLFFFWSLYCLSFGLRFLITHLVSPSFFLNTSTIQKRLYASICARKLQSI